MTLLASACQGVGKRLSSQKIPFTVWTSRQNPAPLHTEELIHSASLIFVFWWDITRVEPCLTREDPFSEGRGEKQTAADAERQNFKPLSKAKPLI